MPVNNRVMLSGRAVREPELRSTAGGTPVLSFTLAVDERVRDRETGAWSDRASFIDCSMYGSRAEKVAQYLRKGSAIHVEGRLRQDRWDDRATGQRRSRVHVVVDDIEIPPRQSSAHEDREQAAPQPEAHSQNPGVYDADIPF